MKRGTKLQAKHLAVAVGWIVGITVLWNVVPGLPDWISVDSMIVGGLCGLLVTAVGNACAVGKRDAAT